jgi:hypothetical protein
MNKHFLGYIGFFLLGTSIACTWGLNERHHPAAAACPSAFWAPDPIAAEFRKYPEGHPMREFFKAYVSQQRQLDAYNGYPGVHGAR